MRVLTLTDVIPALPACVIVRSPRLAGVPNSRGAPDEVDRGATQGRHGAQPDPCVWDHGDLIGQAVPARGNGA